MAAEVTKRVQGVYFFESTVSPRLFVLTDRSQGKPEQKRLEVLLGDVVKTDLPVRILSSPF